MHPITALSVGVSLAGTACVRQQRQSADTAQRRCHRPHLKMLRAGPLALLLLLVGGGGADRIDIQRDQRSGEVSARQATAGGGPAIGEEQDGR